MKYALIKDGYVRNTIVADPEFVTTILDQWDYIVSIEDIPPAPGVNWQYDGVNFIPPEYIYE